MKMKDKKTMSRTLGAAAMATAALILASGTAQAKSWGPVKITRNLSSGVVVGTATFKANGDKLTVCDKRADGHSVTVAVYYNNHDANPIWRVKAKRKGDCVTKSKNLKERHTYYFYAEHGNDADQKLPQSTAA